MNKVELIAAVAEKSGISKKDAERVLSATFETITATMANGERVQLSGFGIFETKTREARVGRNPKTKETIEIPATTAPVFKASYEVKIGDRLEIALGNRTVAVEVLQVAETVRKDDASAMYKEV